MNLEPILKTELQKLIDELKDKHLELGMKATGKWLESVEMKINNDRGALAAEEYTQYLTKGRPPGSRPPVDALENWVKAKFGLSGQEATSTAFAVANKIAQQGTTWYQEGGSDLLDGVLTSDRTRQFIENVGVFVKQEITQQLQRQLAA